MEGNKKKWNSRTENSREKTQWGACIFEFTGGFLSVSLNASQKNWIGKFGHGDLE